MVEGGKWTRRRDEDEWRNFLNIGGKEIRKNARKDGIARRGKQRKWRDRNAGKGEWKEEFKVGRQTRTEKTND